MGEGPEPGRVFKRNPDAEFSASPGAGYHRAEGQGTDKRRRRLVLRGVALVVAVLVAWLVFGLLVPLWGTHGVVSGLNYTPGRMNEALSRRCIDELGGPAAAADRLSFYLKVTGGSMRRRSAATQLLARCGSHAVPGLAQRLRDGETNVVHIAGGALAKIGSSEAVDELIEAAGEDNYVTASVAIESLGAIGDPQSVDALIDVLGKSNRDLRASAAEALGKIGDRRAVAPLLAVLGEPNVFKRIRIIEALGRLGDHRATAPLAKLLSEKSGNVRREVCVALGRLRDPAAVNALIGAVKDGSEWVRPAAIKALGQIGDPRATKALVEALKSEDVMIPSAAVEALGRVGGQEARRALHRVAKHWDPEMRALAALALGRSGDPAGADMLIALLAGKHKQRPFPKINSDNVKLQRVVKWMDARRMRTQATRRRAAAELLGRYSGEKVIRALKGALRDKDATVREAAAQALKRLEAHGGNSP